MTLLCPYGLNFPYIFTDYRVTRKSPRQTQEIDKPKLALYIPDIKLYKEVKIFNVIFYLGQGKQFYKYFQEHFEMLFKPAF